MLFFFFFFRKIFISFLTLFSSFFFFLRKILISFTCFFLKFFFVFFYNIYLPFLYRYTKNYKKIFISYVSIFLVFSIKIFFIRILFIRIFFIRIFSIRIRRNFYILNDVLRNLFFFDNIFTFFEKHSRAIIFACSKNRIYQNY